MSLAVWLDAHSEAVEASLDRYYNGLDLRDWYRGRWTARWLWSRLISLPLDSPLALSTYDEYEAEAPRAIGPAAPPNAMPWPPTDLSTIPVAKSMAQVGDLLSGADLSPHAN